MGIANYLAACRAIRRNPGVSTVTGIARHTLWHGVKRFAPLPISIPLTPASTLHIAQRAGMAGCAALAWSMKLYDYNNMQFLRHYLSQRPTTVCFDIGANIGVYALIMSEQPGTPVHCFEPHPQTHSALRECLQANHRSNVTCHQLALSDAPGSVAFTDTPCCAVNQIVADSHVSQTIRVTARTAASFIEEHGIVPEIVKIDTEGHEPAILAGFGQWLSSVKLLLIEENMPQQTQQLLTTNHAFHGPLYIDHERRCITPRLICREDALFVHRDHVSVLTQLGYHVEL